MKHFTINTLTNEIQGDGIPTTKTVGKETVNVSPPNIGGHLIVVQAMEAADVPAALNAKHSAMAAGTTPKIQPFFSDYKPQ